MHRMVIATTRMRHGFCPSSRKVSDINNNNQITMDICVVTPSVRDQITDSRVLVTLTYQFVAFVEGVEQGNQEVDDESQVE